MSSYDIKLRKDKKEGGRKVLGSGLESVLKLSNIETNTTSSQEELKRVMVNQLVPGTFQPRHDFDELSLKELSDSIAQRGILQPIIVRKTGKVGEYEIIAGERRWRAAMMAGLQQVPVVICNINNESALAFGLIENIQRQALNPIEEAMALKRLIDEFKMTHEKVAESIGRSRAVVTNTLRLLNLYAPVQEMLIAKKIEIGHAKLLLTLPDLEQLEIAETIFKKNMTVRETEKCLNHKKNINAPAHKMMNVNVRNKGLSTLLTKKVNTKAVVELNSFGAGRIIIHIASENELLKIIEKL